MNFCHILPTKHLDLVQGRSFHLTLARLVETDPKYVQFYKEQKAKHSCTIIMDNSGFEMFKQGKPMYPGFKLVQMANSVNADYIVMPDYPGHVSTHTIDAATEFGPQFKQAGFKTFFVPQGRTGDIVDLIGCYRWAANNPGLVDYIGVSILSAPLAFNVERGNKLQRFVSRLYLMYLLKEEGILDQLRENGQKIHLLGMLDGPHEIMYMNPFKQYIDTWDSSAAGWLGLGGNQTFDNTPTGRLDGKYEEEVDFDFFTTDPDKIAKAKLNIEYINKLVEKYLG